MRFFIIISLVLATALSSAEIKSTTVAYAQGGVDFEAVLVYDDAVKERRPGVLIVHEWWGLDEYPKKRAEQLAKLGYVAFAADVFGKGKVTKDPKQAGAWAGALKGNRQLLRERAGAALEALKKQEQVDTTKIAAIGYCFGGTTALELARSGADIRGAVSFHGSLDTTTPLDAKNIKGSVLVLHGGDDKMVPDAQVVAFQEEMRNAGVDWQLVSYGGAVHSFTNPAAGSDKSRSVAYDEKADKRSWQAMLKFFEEIFGAAAQ